MHPRLAAILIFLLVLVSVFLRSPALFLLEGLIFLMWGASALWGKYCLAGVGYSRQFAAQRLFCGEETDVWVEMVNAKPLPLAWLSAADDFPAEAHLRNIKLASSSDPQRRTLANVLSFRWYERVRRHYRLTLNRRGVFEFGPAVLSSGDLFGFRTRYLDLPLKQTLLVYPKVVPLDHLPLRAARPMGDYAAQRRVLTDPLRLAGTRDYAPGDSVRHIHWKATARKGALQTKIFDPSASHQLALFLNAQTLEHAYEGVVSDYLETAIVVAASVALAGLELRYPTGLFTNGTPRQTNRRVRLPPSRHTTQAVQILETLAQLTPFTFLGFDGVVRLEAPELPFGTTLVAVTAVLTESILSALLDARANGHPVALIVIGPPPDENSLSGFDMPVYSVAQNWTDLETLQLAG